MNKRKQRSLSKYAAVTFDFCPVSITTSSPQTHVPDLSTKSTKSIVFISNLAKISTHSAGANTKRRAEHGESRGPTLSAAAPPWLPPPPPPPPPASAYYDNNMQKKKKKTRTGKRGPNQLTIHQRKRHYETVHTLEM